MILAAIAALTMSAQAQNYATINVGDMDDAVVYNGSYFDMAPTTFYVAHTGCQMLYTPDLLADMNGKQNVLIKSLDFWFSCETYEEIARNVKIYLQETDATEFAINEEGVKQFFEFGEPVKEMAINIDMLSYYGEDVCLNFDFEPFAFTPGKSLLITMIFDAEDDDNCTMGSDYAAFYTSGIRSHAMTYTNNTTSFVDYANGNDFPDATATLGCGTNVELPVTRIGYNYEEAIPEPQGIVPANPTADNWYDCGDESGFSKFYFTLPTTDVNGNDLNPENLSYAVWINDGFGEVYQFTFPAEDYRYDLYYDIDEVPYWLYSSAVDFRDYFVYMYRTNENDNPLFVRDEEHNGNIGIQVFYTSEDRAKTASDIVWLYEDETPEPPEPPTPTESVILVIVDQDGVEHFFELAKGDNGDFTTTVAMTYVPYGQEYWDPNLTDEENEANRPIAPFYFIINDQRYGAEGMRPTVLGLALENPLDGEADGFYTIPVGFNYTLGVAVNENEYYVYAAVASFTGVDELNANKPVAGVRYFNMAGQEMAQPSGLTIVVTTYTDGTTSAVKVIK